MAAALIAGKDYFNYLPRFDNKAWGEWTGCGPACPSVHLGALFDHNPAWTKATFSFLGSLPKEAAGGLFQGDGSVARALLWLGISDL